MPKKKADHKQAPHQIETTADLDVGGTQYRPGRLYWLTLVFGSRSSLTHTRLWHTSKARKWCQKAMMHACQPMLFPWVSPSRSRSPSFVRCGLQGGRRTRGDGSVPRRGSRQTSQHRAGPCGRAVRLDRKTLTRAGNQRNLAYCVAVWARSATAVRYAGMQVRSELDSAQARKRRGTGRSRGILFGGCQG